MVRVNSDNYFLRVEIDALLEEAGADPRVGLEVARSYESRQQMIENEPPHLSRTPNEALFEVIYGHWQIGECCIVRRENGELACNTLIPEALATTIQIVEDRGDFFDRSYRLLRSESH